MTEKFKIEKLSIEESEKVKGGLSAPKANNNEQGAKDYSGCACACGD